VIGLSGGCGEDAGRMCAGLLLNPDFYLPRVAVFMFRGYLGACFHHPGVSAACLCVTARYK
jgi:hypothetical protein